jgi:hypothetical protein
MMKTIIRKLRLAPPILFASLIGGMLLGSGIALASDIWESLSPGFNHVGGTQTEGSWWQYDADYYDWMNSGSTRADSISTSYTNGSVDNQNATFKWLYIYDEYGYDTQVFWNFVDYQINWTPLSGNTANTMDQLSTSNNYVLHQQYIEYSVGTYSDYVISYTGIGSP